MDKLANCLTNYIIIKGVADKELYDAYRYGFVSLMETSVSIIISLIIAIWLNMFIACILFFLIFIPLRSFAGGLHLKTYLRCLILSCFTFSLILVTVKYMIFLGEYSLIGSAIFLMMIRLLYPVEHVNRPVDNEEKVAFKKTLLRIISVDLFVAIVLFVMKWNSLAFLETVTLALVAITMVIGKLMYNCGIEKKQALS